VAAFLAFFLGTFGIHKFYLGRTFGGFFYMFFFIMSIRIFKFPLSTILGFIDSISLLGMSDERFDQKYNKEYHEQQKTQLNPATGRAPVRRQNTHVKESRTIENNGVPTKSNPFKASGIQHYKNFDLDLAIEDFKKSLKIQANDPAMYFNLACAYSLTEQKDKCLQSIDTAVKQGFKDYAKFLSHDDLAYIRIQPEFDQLRLNGFRLVNGISPQTQKDPQSQSKGEANDASEEVVITDEGLLTQLQRLSDLRERGLLSEQEFNIERRKILRR
jgi:TM2 domain-containing membrane protein YozV